MLHPIHSFRKILAVLFFSVPMFSTANPSREEIVSGMKKATRFHA